MEYVICEIVIARVVNDNIFIDKFQIVLKFRKIFKKLLDIILPGLPNIIILFFFGSRPLSLDTKKYINGFAKGRIFKNILYKLKLIATLNLVEKWFFIGNAER